MNKLCQFSQQLLLCKPITDSNDSLLCGRYNKRAKAASDVEYPAYGVTGPTKDRLPSPGDRKLAQSAQMYHYQHQKQQMIAMEK